MLSPQKVEIKWQLICQFTSFSIQKAILNDVDNSIICPTISWTVITLATANLIRISLTTRTNASTATKLVKGFGLESPTHKIRKGYQC